VRGEASVSGPADAQVFAIAEPTPPSVGTKFADPVLSGPGPASERLVKGNGSVTVKSARSLLLTRPKWPNEPDDEVTVVVQPDSSSRVRIDRSNTEAQCIDAERRRLEREQAELEAQ